MKVSQLISELQKQPHDADVVIIYDGEPRLDANLVWLTRDGFVAVTDFGEPVYSEGSFPPVNDFLDRSEPGIPYTPKKP